jgi:hypothetical protein
LQCIQAFLETFMNQSCTAFRVRLGAFHRCQPFCTLTDCDMFG